MNPTRKRRGKHFSIFEQTREKGRGWRLRKGFRKNVQKILGPLKKNCTQVEKTGQF